MTITKGNGWQLNLGRWQDVTEDWDRCDALITDPPYSERTHGRQHERRNGISYSQVTDAHHAAAGMLAHVDGWAIMITDHDTWRKFDAAAQEAGRYTFAPLPLVSIGGRVRLAGDGPSSWTVWIHASRPRERPWSKWGTLPGAYIERGRVKGRPIVGCKQLDTMRKIVRDYTQPGDVVWDPYAGTGTTLLAAVMEGRRAVGAEVNPDTYAYAVERLQRHDAQPGLPGVLP